MAGEDGNTDEGGVLFLFLLEGTAGFVLGIITGGTVRGADTELLL